MALSRFAGRGRRPRLRLVAPTLSTPRRVMPWLIDGYTRVVVEFWTEAEWSLLCEAERPSSAAILPGVGWILVARPSDPEYHDATDSYSMAMKTWRAERRIE